VPDPVVMETAEKSSVGRVADYLPPKLVGKTGYKKTPDGMFSSLLSLFTGHFLVLTDNIVTDDKGVSSTARDNLVNECTNMGLISALMLTIVVPLVFDNLTDWLEEDFVGSGYAYLDGWIGQQGGENAVLSSIPALHDLSLICYVVGAVGYFCSTVVTVLILLCVGEIETNAGVEEFMRNVGNGTRVPFFFFWNGNIFVIPAIIRWILSCKTLGGLITLGVAVLTLVVLVLSAATHYVRCCIQTHNAVNELDELHLSLREAEEDVNAWFEHNPETGSLQDCLLDLAGLHNKVHIGLNTVSQERVAMFWHKKNAEIIGVPLSNLDLYRMAYRAQ